MTRDSDQANYHSMSAWFARPIFHLMKAIIF